MKIVAEWYVHGKKTNMRIRRLLAREGYRQNEGFPNIYTGEGVSVSVGHIRYTGSGVEPSPPRLFFGGDVETKSSGRYSPYRPQVRITLRSESLFLGNQIYETLDSVVGRLSNSKMKLTAKVS